MLKYTMTFLYIMSIIELFFYIRLYISQQWRRTQLKRTFGDRFSWISKAGLSRWSCFMSSLRKWKSKLRYHYQRIKLWSQNNNMKRCSIADNKYGINSINSTSATFSRIEPILKGKCQRLLSSKIFTKKLEKPVITMN